MKEDEINSAERQAYLSAFEAMEEGFRTLHSKFPEKTISIRQAAELLSTFKAGFCYGYEKEYPSAKNGDGKSAPWRKRWSGAVREWEKELRKSQ